MSQGLRDVEQPLEIGRKGDDAEQSEDERTRKEVREPGDNKGNERDLADGGASSPLSVKHIIRKKELLQELFDTLPERVFSVLGETAEGISQQRFA